MRFMKIRQGLFFLSPQQLNYFYCSEDKKRLYHYIESGYYRMSDYDINHMKLDALLEFSFKYKLKIFEMFSRDKFYSMLTDKSKIELYKNGT